MIAIVDLANALTAFDDSLRIFRTDRLTLNGCGNKQFKLTRNLQVLKQHGCNSVLTFGGLWSNHLHAFALACEVMNIRAVAVIRGETTAGSTLLIDAVRHGLEVHYVSRTEYQRRHDQMYCSAKCMQLACDEWLPEGGSNQLAVEGCAEIAELTNKCMQRHPTHIALAVGTGATMAGIVRGAEAGQQVLGLPVVQDDRLPSMLKGWVADRSDVGWTLYPGARPPRYGKVDKSLLEFVLETYNRTGVILDPVYNAKAFRALLESGIAEKPGNRVVFVHTGGVGGCLGFAEKLAAIDEVTTSALLSEVSQMLDIDAPGT